MPDRGSIRLMLVDDHFFVRKGLAASLNEERGLHVISEARNAEEALCCFRTCTPAVTLMDLAMNGGDGITGVASIRAEFPDARILILSVSESEEDVFRAMEAGACGYLAKSVDREELIRAIRVVHGGGQYLPTPLAERLRMRKARHPLSPREHSVLERIVAGRCNKEIAEDLGLSELTVRQYVSGLLAKLEVADRTQAATVAVQRGIVRLGN